MGSHAVTSARCQHNMCGGGRFQIGKVRSNPDTAAGGPLSTPSPDATIARHIRPAHELSMFAPIRRDIALRHGEWRDTLTIEPCTVTV